MQQAIATSEIIDVPFIFSSNGDAFMMCDRTITKVQREREIPSINSRHRRNFGKNTARVRELTHRFSRFLLKITTPVLIKNSHKPQPGQQDKYGKEIPDQVFKL